MPKLSLTPLVRLGVAAMLIAACNLNNDSVDYSLPGFGGSSGAGGIYGDAGHPVSPPGPCDDAEEHGACLESDSTDGEGVAYNAQCEVKSSANYVCNAALECDGYWTWVKPKRASCATSCPSAYADHYEGCADPANASLICEYQEGTCGCAPVDADGGVDDAGDAGVVDAAIDGDGGDDAAAPVVARAWRCVVPEVGCPRLRPRAGDDCVKPMECNYGACVFDDGVTMRCEGRRWIASTCTE